MNKGEIGMKESNFSQKMTCNVSIELHEFINDILNGRAQDRGITTLMER